MHIFLISERLECIGKRRKVLNAWHLPFFAGNWFIWRYFFEENLRFSEACLFLRFSLKLIFFLKTFLGFSTKKIFVKSSHRQRLVLSFISRKKLLILIYLFNYKLKIKNPFKKLLLENSRDFLNCFFLDSLNVRVLWSGRGGIFEMIYHNIRKIDIIVHLDHFLRLFHATFLYSVTNLPSHSIYLLQWQWMLYLTN